MTYNKEIAKLVDASHDQNVASYFAQRTPFNVAMPLAFWARYLWPSMGRNPMVPKVCFILFL
jgi:hypothetical protein